MDYRYSYILVVVDSNLRFFVGGGDKDSALSSAALLELSAILFNGIEESRFLDGFQVGPLLRLPSCWLESGDPWSVAGASSNSLHVLKSILRIDHLQYR